MFGGFRSKEQREREGGRKEGTKIVFTNSTRRGPKREIYLA